MFGIDPNLSDPAQGGETCFYLNPGAPDWWMSDDVRLIPPSSPMSPPPNANVAVNNAVNTVHVTVNRKTDNCTPISQSVNWTYLKVELFVCNPTTTWPLSENDPNVLQILSYDPAINPCNNLRILKSAFTGTSQSVDFNWKIPHDPCYTTIPTTPHIAEQPKHKCLIARAYPYRSGMSLDGVLHAGPDPAHGNGDQHYAQHNICIDSCMSPCGVELWTGNTTQTPRNISLRLVHDLKPSRQMQQTIANELKIWGIPFERFADTPPAKGFNLQLKDFPSAKFVVDQPPNLEVTSTTNRTQPDGCSRIIQQLLGGVLGRPASPAPKSRPTIVPTPLTNPTLFITPSLETQIQLAPGQTSSDYTFETDLDAVNPGTVHLFHVMEIENGELIGGVTMVMVKQ